MHRRTFLFTSVGGFAALAAGKIKLKNPVPRRPYKGEVDLSIIGFGGIVAAGMEQSMASQLVAEAYGCGINYYDVAPSYFNGEAETKLGIALEPYRQKVFLACKTAQRDAEGARKELEASLERLRTDYFDLYQFHAVTKMEDVDRIFGPKGAAETFVRARQEGTIRHIGFSAHSEEAAFAMLDKYPFDSVLFPINYVCISQGNFGPRVIARAREKGAARLALKAMAQTVWPADLKKEARAYPKCWYQPIDDSEQAAKALRFTLSQDITAAIPPGDERLFMMALHIASNYGPMSKEEQDQLLASAAGTTPIFKHAG